ncbi:MAG: ATP-binding protein [Planctomycetota bacterium]
MASFNGSSTQFAGEGPPKIHLTCRMVGGEFILGVKDNGPGIEPEQQERIFQPFKRGAGNQQVEGAGIGLAICQKVTSLHLGRLWVESEPGQGCHFQFTLGEPVPVEEPEPVRA